MDFAHFDIRNYPTLPVRDGYGEWAASYEATVQDEMDLRLLDRVRAVAWGGVRRAIDLACGTGRVGVWLAARGARAIDGVDLTPEMLDAARHKGVYRDLRVADVFDTRLDAGAYDLAVQSLADEHLPELDPLYREAARLVAPGGHFALVGFHPHFLMLGVPTHYDRAPGESVTIRSYVHLTSDHVRAALAAGWRLAEMHEGVIDDAWLAKKPKWERYRHHPVTFAMIWAR